jgi:hypothetical protein
MKKHFDCVAMKDRIQRRLLTEMKGLTTEQKRATIREVLDGSLSSVGELWRQISGEARTTTSRVAESAAVYGSKHSKKGM